MLPPWAGKKPDPNLGYEIAHSPHTAPGWRIVGDDIYTCIEPAQGPYVDPDVLKAIHEFDPGAIPIWRVQVYLPPGKMGEQHLVKVAHVGIARYVRNPSAAHALMHVSMPENPTHPQPNVLEFIWEDDTEARKHGGPNAILPFDWKLHKYMETRVARNQSAPQMVKDWLERIREKQEREALASRAELAYRQRHLEKAVQKTLESVTPKELWQQYMELRQRRRLSQPKPYVFHGGN